MLVRHVAQPVVHTHRRISNVVSCHGLRWAIISIFLCTCCLLCAAGADSDGERQAKAKKRHLAATKWCLEESNYRMNVTNDEIQTGWLNRKTMDQALKTMRRCGYVKLSGVIDRVALGRIRKEIYEFLEGNPSTPLVHGQGAPGRSEFMLPASAQFMEGAIVNSTLLMPLLAEMFAASQVMKDFPGGQVTEAFVLDVVTQIAVGSNTTAQHAHTDIPHTSLLTDDPTAEFAYELYGYPVIGALRGSGTWRAITSGLASNAINLQMPLSEDITMENGPTNFCPATHLDSTCAMYLGCPVGKAPVTEAEDSLLSAKILGYTKSKICGPSRRAYGTNRVGDVLLYDMRIIHWGGENRGNRMRDILSLSYTHFWFHFKGRPFSEEAEDESDKWRRAGFGIAWNDPSSLNQKRQEL